VFALVTRLGRHIELPELHPFSFLGGKATRNTAVIEAKLVIYLRFIWYQSSRLALALCKRRVEAGLWRAVVAGIWSLRRSGWRASPKCCLHHQPTIITTQQTPNEIFIEVAAHSYKAVIGW